MVEVLQEDVNSAGEPAAVLYQTRLEALEVLEDYSARAAQYELRERRSRVAQGAVWLAPLISACIIVSPGVREHIDVDYITPIEAAALLFSALSCTAAGMVEEASILKRKAMAKVATPLVQDLGVATPQWLERAINAQTDLVPMHTANKQGGV